jgi:RNA polymerase sigma factor (sigma-70 family)
VSAAVALAPDAVGAVWTPERLHAHYASKVARLVRAVLGRDDEHEDLVQDVLMTVFVEIGRLRDPACLDRWVSQITLNKLRYLMRRRRIRRHASLESLPEQTSPSFQIELDARELASRAMRVMGRLPPTDQALLATYWFSTATIGSMAADAGCSAVTVRRRLFKARSRFAKLARRDPELASFIESSPRASAGWCSTDSS